MFKKIQMIIAFLMLISVQSFAQLSISPAPVSGKINLNTTSSTINISNTSSTPISLSLSLSQTGFSMGIDRCSGKTLAKNQSCYFVISVNDSVLPQMENIADLKNNGLSLVNLKRSKIQSLGASLFGQSSVSFPDFLSKSITIQNKTSSIKSYSPVLSGTDSSKFEILLNRCSNVGVGQTCSISVRLKPQMEGSYSASLSEPQISLPVSLSSTITSSTSGVILPLVESMSISSLSLNFGTLTSFSISTAQNITISNTGTLTISPIISASSKMAIVMNRCISLPPGQSCSLSVSMKPSSSDVNGSLAGSISIKSSASATAQSVSASSLLSVPPAYLTGSSQGGTCAASTHFEGAVCVSDIRSCAPSSLTSIILGGNQLWSGSTWGSCIPQQASDCANGYVYSSNSCQAAQYIVEEGIYGGGGFTNIFVGWEPSEMMIVTISQKTRLTDFTFFAYQTGGNPPTSVMVFDNYSSTAGRPGDTSVNLLGKSNYNSFTGGASYVTFLFNQGDVILNPGIYYFIFERTWDGALWFPNANSFINGGNHYLFYNPVFSISTSGPVFRLRGELVP